MALSVGDKLGPYEILAPLGEGGMGEVWQARDIRLDRIVALKITKGQFTDRFQREARAIAALNHPHICQLYDVGPHFLVIEYVDGPTLADRIASGPVPVDEALSIARQIAHALDAAHEKGIVHRDLKPGNIKLTPAGDVKLLDFGLATAYAHAGASSPSTVPTQTITAQDVILGTAAYMSPEQARGQRVDKRTDIWAFGLVLLEMLTGRRVFEGVTVSDTMAAVLTKEPPYERAPERLRRLLRLCLEKDPSKRLRDISAVDLLLSEPSVQVARRRWWIASTAVLALLLCVVLWRPWAGRDARPEFSRFDLDLGSAALYFASAGPDVIITPDARRLAYIVTGDDGVQRLYTRNLTEQRGRAINGTEGAYAPFFSPDGNWVGFFAGGRLQKVSVHGGSPIPICNAPLGRGAAWTPDGWIIASLTATSGLHRISADGGSPEPLTLLTGAELTHRWPQLLPGTQYVFFTSNSRTSEFQNANIELLSLADRSRTILHRGGTFGRYLQSGHLAWVSTGGMFAAPFDVRRKQLGVGALVLDDVEYSMLNGGAQFDSAKSMLIYRSGTADPGYRSLYWLDAAGKTDRLGMKPDVYFGPALSPNAEWLASVAADAVVLTHLRTGGTRRLSPPSGRSPVWTPDGQFVLYGLGGDLHAVRIHGGDKPLVLYQTGDRTNHVRPTSVTADGTRLLVSQVNGETGTDLLVFPVHREGIGLRLGNPEVFLQTPAEEDGATFSPDGAWVAYHSNESGINEVYVRSLKDRAAKWLVSSRGGLFPKWSRTAKELVFRTPDGRTMVAAYDGRGESFVSETPRFFSEQHILAENYLSPNFDIAPDGKRLLVLLPPNPSILARPPKPIHVLVHFAEQFRGRENQ